MAAPTLPSWSWPLVTSSRFSCRFGTLLARPTACQPAERLARALIEQTADDAEDRALAEQRSDQLLQWDLTVLGVGSVLVVEHAP